MKSFIQTTSAEIINQFGNLKVYCLNFVFGWINYIFLFIGLFFGSSINKATPIEKEIYLIGLSVWFITSYAIQSVSIIIQTQSRQGTLEQLFVTRSSITRIIISKLISGFLFEILQLLIIIVVSMQFYNLKISQITISFFEISVRFIPLFFGLTGISLLVAGLSMIYKRTQAVARATTNLILFFSGLILPITVVPKIFSVMAYIFPFHWFMKSIYLKHIYYNIKGSLISFGIYSIICIIWALIGLFSFNKCVYKSKIIGALSHY